MPAPAAVVATQPPAAQVLTITASHDDWLYRVGERASFTVRVLQNGRERPGVRVIVTLAPERMKPMRVDTIALPAGGARIDGALSAPGFLRLTATAEVDGMPLSEMATVGFNVSDIDASATLPDDFLAFWQKAIAEARRVPLAPQLTARPDLSTKTVDVYHVSFQNQKEGSRLYGMLSVPKAPGRYPAMLVVPGAGVRPYFPNTRLAARGVVHLTIGIHGIPVDRDSLLYNELRATALSGYQFFGIEDRDKYYYKRVIVGAVRAGDFLMSLPQVDTARYVVRGGSQGGMLTLAAAALDPRVKAIAVAHPALADHFGYRRGRAGGWPHVFADTSRLKAKAEIAATLPYYDGDNFARLVRVPGFYTWGYNDLTVAPTSAYAAYNLVSAPKELFIVKEIGHVQTPEMVARTEAFLLRHLGVTP
ncbi:MAG: acetylxylan esterase [Gemmatimonadaceae bacterium]|nr:acetylxylan esterase [Gemmatimonadaceae bacterium]